MKLDKSAAHYRVKKATDPGYLVNREEKRGMPAKIALGEPLPDEIEIMPPPEALEGCCSVEVQMEGINEEGTEEDEEDALRAEPLLPPDSHLNTSTPRASAPLDTDALGPGWWGVDGEPVVCAQCHDPGEPLWSCSSVEGIIPLHRECQPFWFKRYPQPKGTLITCVTIEVIPSPAIVASPQDVQDILEPRLRS